MRRTLLIATTNQGKYKEMAAYFKTQPYLECISLSDLEEHIPAPEEDRDTFAENALLKAKYYAEKTNMLTISEDTGLVIDALDGWPGVMSARVGASDEQRIEKVLAKVGQCRIKTAAFCNATAVYDPKEKSSYIAYGKTKGKIVKNKTGDQGFGYDPIFYVTSADKTYAEMTVDEKNSYSHRGKALSKVKYYFHNTIAPKHIVVPAGILIRDGKIMMSLRNDPQNIASHRRWEFPGGTVEFGESIEENLKREVREEVGYDIEVLQPFNYIHLEERKTDRYACQIFILPYACKIIGGTGEFSEQETLEIRWFKLDDVLDFDLLGSNVLMYRKIRPQLEEIIASL